MKVEWRDYEPSDKEAVIQLHREMEARLGRKMDLPDLDLQPILIAQVGLVDGVVKYCVYLEAEVEACVAGCSPLSAKQLAPAVARLKAVADSYRIRIVRCFVPQSMLSSRPEREWVEKPWRPTPLERTLKALGLKREDKSMAQFFRWL